MKNLVRAFVVALAITGFAAASHVSAQTSPNTVIASKTSAFPIPVCPPDDPTGCNNPYAVSDSK